LSDTLQQLRMGKPKKRVSPRVANEVGLRQACYTVHRQRIENSKRPMGTSYIRSSMLGPKNRRRLCFRDDLP
jgi:hypothetical protein